MDEIKVEKKVSSEPVEDKKPVRSDSADVPHFMPLSSMVGVSDPTPEQKEQLAKVWDYFAKDNESTSSRLYAIQNTLNRMGHNLGQNDLDKIHRWVSLRVDIDEKEKLLNSL